MDAFNRNKKNFLALMDRYIDRDVMVAFSGGVDSSLVLKVACEQALGKNHRVYAVTVHTMLHPVNEIATTAKAAKEMGAVHTVVEIDELQHAGVMTNPLNRCYLCKKYLFTRLVAMAGELRVETIMDGTNSDDLQDYRPGLQALRELNIRSPLAEAAMSKTDVRKMAAEYDLSASTSPSSPCLATRFPYGTPLSYEKMRNVEKGEIYIRSLGFFNVRLRVHGDVARLEVDSSDMERIVACREDIVSFLKNLGYLYVTVDLEGFRSGSMDYKIEKPKKIR
ncbi:ATP-dependent sacrificial sulfur transferase LarE [Desulforhopalus singaporensis]|uniref:Asparagine synthetase domain-containing protein n=1 Tax=Desulforhopalus singaporensis TaxID=91360 RepID=A0A1H0SMM0_9BACT|nr:ATP-dependent sacrificial sulfur transferase LarE [Desulforhopalus singaporensis]SDP42488.1 uncharacterized protein SAMN05660330_02738 [Desulforhopalus singaporensis]